ncbi:MAG: DPP IV N-terminal domain-containing protein [Actinomycetota bacterium]|nr:DPP IV N-terminal domain-containing protein [Actinomycetota bacterium]
MSRATRHTVRSALAAGAAAVLVAAVPVAARAASPGTNGRIAFEMSGVIYSVQPNGSGQQTLTSGPDDHSPHWSPNGRKIAFERAGDLWLMRADGSHQQRLTSGPGDDISPAWSPDGTKLVFVRSDDGSYAGRSMFVKPVAGGLPTRLTTADDGCADGPSWSSDGRLVVYADDCGLGPRSLRKVNLRTGAISDIIGVGGFAGPGGQWHFDGSAPDITPDSTHVVFTAANPSDVCGVGITDLSGGGFRQVAQSGDCGVFLADDPAVSPDGKKLAYTAGNENPQLDVVKLSGTNQCCSPILSALHFPLNADWQPKP